jgi:hypothetical protein
MRIASLTALLLTAGCGPGGEPRIEEALQYKSYGRVDDASRWAPMDCEPPPPLKSQSRDPETHGRKLYYLFAKDREAYRIARDRDQPVGQVIVKESWIPGTKQQGPLFLMMKTGEPDSDEGWIYATATPDGKTITARGKLASCMECHHGAKRDRLFAVSCH